MISSLLDTDLYKFTMMQTVLHQFPGAMVEYGFKCRDTNIDLKPFLPEFEQAIDDLCQLQFKQDELDYLASFTFFKSDFIHFLRIFQLNPDFISIETKPEFTIRIRGPWLHTIMFEVPLLAILSELVSQARYPAAESVGRERLQEKIKLVKNHLHGESFYFSDFGTRRRYSKCWQDEVVATLAEQLPDNFTGTSNVYLAKKHCIKPIGTMAHEYLEACQSLGPKLSHSQRFAFEVWAQEYRGELGIALSDVIGLDAFLHDFDMYFCKLFDGARHDSGDPFNWGDRLISHYEAMRIDPRSKTLVFSDKLTMPLALQLFDYFKDRARPVFGIGTHLTNDLGHEPVQMVIKMLECNGQAVAKISDSPGKTMCRDESYLAYLRKVFAVAVD